MSGWIKIHRSITNHWLYTEKRVFSKFEAWNDIAGIGAGAGTRVGVRANCDRQLDGRLGERAGALHDAGGAGDGQPAGGGGVVPRGV